MDQIQTDLVNMAKDAGRWVLDAAVGLAIAVAIIYLSRFIRRRIRKGAEDKKVRNNIPSLINTVLRVVTYLVVGLIVLSAFGVNTSSLVTYLGLVSAALTLSLQDVLRNVFSGMYLMAEQPFMPGDRIRVGPESGRVERIDLRITRLRSDRQEEIMIPNSTVFTQVVGSTSTMRFRPMTLQLTEVVAEPEEAEAAMRETIAPHLTDSARIQFRIMKASKKGSDFELTIRRTDTEAQQNEIILALHKLYPDAVLTVIGR